MAFNWETFRTRTLTAILFAAVMLTGLLWNQWSFFILFSIIHFGCWIEFQRLVEKIDPGYKTRTPVHQYGIMLVGWSLMFLFAAPFYRIGDMSFYHMGYWGGLILLALFLISELFYIKGIRGKNFGHSIFGLVYISLSWGLMMALYRSFDADLDTTEKILDPRVIPVTIVAAIWINDTMAYIVGSLIGKTPLTSISPKKTWEGTLGGIVLSVVVCGLLARFVFQFGKFTFHIMIIAAITAIMGTMGDLLESKLKRLAGVKDSGSMMPGHGGFLDRFDSMLLAIPFVWIYVTLFLK